jgi:hypothetical protein
MKNKTRAPVSHKLANAQIWLASLYAIGFLVVIVLLVTLWAQIGESAKAILAGLIGYLGALVQQQSSFFFARERPKDIDDLAAGGASATLTPILPESIVPAVAPTEPTQQ